MAVANSAPDLVKTIMYIVLDQSVFAHSYRLYVSTDLNNMKWISLWRAFCDDTFLAIY